MTVMTDGLMRVPPVAPKHHPPLVEARCAAGRDHRAGCDQGCAERQPAPPRPGDPASPGQRDHHVLARGDPGGHQRGQHPGHHREPGEGEQRRREHPEAAAPGVGELRLEQRPTGPPDGDAERDADGRRHRAEHHTVGEHDPA
jgi:hypothetical protein